MRQPPVWGRPRSRSITTTTTVAVAAVIVLAAAVIVWAIRDHYQWQTWCESTGGHVASHTSTHFVTTYGSKGRTGVGTSTDTTYYCLTADGRILDIR